MVSLMNMLLQTDVAIRVHDNVASIDTRYMYKGHGLKNTTPKVSV